MCAVEVSDDVPSLGWFWGAFAVAILCPVVTLAGGREPTGAWFAGGALSEPFGTATTLEQACAVIATSKTNQQSDFADARFTRVMVEL
jgi:hypothetical protein